MPNNPFIYIPENIHESFSGSNRKNMENGTMLLPNSKPVCKYDPESKYISYADKENSYHFHHGSSIVSSGSDEYMPHYHPVYEIFIYISGKAEFSIETAIFRLNPYDIIIVPPYTIHKPIPAVGEVFERYVINIFPDFFIKMDCTQYRNAFAGNPLLKCKIPGHTVKRTGIMSLLDFFKSGYDGSIYTQPLLGFKIAELMYYINTLDSFEGFDPVNNVVQDIILYIDKNFSTITSVQNVTGNFYYSKNYLSKIFKKHTGITIPRYINMKKMENVEKLYKQGISLTHACVESGFSSYNNFAYIYKSEFGISPRQGLIKSVIK